MDMRTKAQELVEINSALSDGRLVLVNDEGKVAQAYLGALDFIDSMANFDSNLVGLNAEQNNAGVKMTTQVVRGMARDFLGKVSEE